MGLNCDEKRGCSDGSRGIDAELTYAKERSLRG